MGIWLQKDMSKIFQMRYQTFILVKRMQKYQRSKLEIEKKSASSAWPRVRRIPIWSHWKFFSRPQILASDIFVAS